LPFVLVVTIFIRSQAAGRCNPRWDVGVAHSHCCRLCGFKFRKCGSRRHFEKVETVRKVCTSLTVRKRVGLSWKFLNTFGFSRGAIQLRSVALYVRYKIHEFMINSHWIYTGRKTAALPWFPATTSRSFQFLDILRLFWAVAGRAFVVYQAFIWQLVKQFKYHPRYVTLSISCRLFLESQPNCYANWSKNCWWPLACRDHRAFNLCCILGSLRHLSDYRCEKTTNERGALWTLSGHCHTQRTPCGPDNTIRTRLTTWCSRPNL
jgi:hypothetical protein